MTVTAVIAEDEAPQRAELRAILAELWPDLLVLAECADGTAALVAVKRHRPDVAFLDIRMPGASGLDVARAAGSQAHIVFITAFDEFAVQAFEDGAADYLLKPVSRDRLNAAILRLKGRLASGKPIDLSALLARLETQPPTPAHRIRWITASVGAAVRMIPIDEVLFFQSQNKYTRVVTAGEEAHIRMPLKELIGQLDPEMFWQVHRGALVNASAIRVAKRDEDGKLQLHITGKMETLAVSPTYAGRFKSL